MKNDDITKPLVVLLQPNSRVIATIASEMFTRST
jgi:hypothetical protein